jgi:hypothetical protein
VESGYKGRVGSGRVEEWECWSSGPVARVWESQRRVVCLYKLLKVSTEGSISKAVSLFRYGIYLLYLSITLDTVRLAI